MNTEKVTILLVDDDDVDAMAVKRAFRREKIANEIVRAQDGVDALTILRGKSEKKVKHPCIILLDLNMPRMSGLEFLDELRSDRELCRNVVFVLTTSAAEEDISHSYDRQVAGYILKEEAGVGFLKMVKMLDQYWRVVEFPGDKQSSP